VIPALPLALRRNRCWDEIRQRALASYYRDAGAGGRAGAVHSTQFAIRDPKVGLYAPVLALAAATVRADQPPGNSFALIAAEIPLIGFYLQPAVGGRLFSFRFWRQFAEIPELVAIKIAAFNRYRTIDVVRAVLESGRNDVALYTGNDDNIIADLLTPFEFGGQIRHVDGGLLGQWGVWTERAVALFRDLQAARRQPQISGSWATRNAALTDANAAIFDAANNFSGCLPGIHEVLRRQGLLENTLCLDRHERLPPGQSAEITRVTKAYPWLVDDRFVAANLARWLA
jgi:hypothetical protein